VRQLIYSFVFLFFGFGFISQVAAETWYVKISKTKLQAKAKARSKVLGKLNKGTNVLFTKGLDKNLEFEADKYGRESAYRTGYYPGGLERFIQKLGASKKNQSSIFSSTHPTSMERYNLLQKSASRYNKATLYPTLGNRYKLAMKRQN
jgi:beta-barrel assembly-enhancing protease